MVIRRLPGHPAPSQKSPADQGASDREERLVDVGPLFKADAQSPRGGRAAVRVDHRDAKPPSLYGSGRLSMHTGEYRTRRDRDLLAFGRLASGETF